LAAWVRLAPDEFDQKSVIAVLEAFKGKPTLHTLIEMSNDDDWGVRMSVVEALPELLKADDNHEALLNIAVQRASDENYYVAEKAIDALASSVDGPGIFSIVLAKGSQRAQSLALQAIGRNGKTRPDSVNDDLLAAAAALLADPENITRFVATKTLLALAERLPGKSVLIEEYLIENLQDLYPATADRFTDERFARSTVAGHVADLCKRVPGAIDLTIVFLSDDRPGVREGAARAICRLGDSAAHTKNALTLRISEEPSWAVQVWLAAAWEAVTGTTLPEAAWPSVPGVWQMVFFETENEDVVPAGVRFEAHSPLKGLLKSEGDSLYLYWPDNHGVSSSDRLLDEYGPIALHGLMEGDFADLLGQAVDVTGTYRNHEIRVETISARCGSREAT